MNLAARLLRAVAPLQRRVLLMLSRGIVRLVGDERPIQELQISLLRGELRSGVERMQECGFTSVPMPGAWAIAACIGGNRDHPVVIATDDGRHRPRNLAPGEVALYDPGGQLVHLRADGSVLVSAADKVLVAGTNRVEIQAGDQVEVVAGTSIRLDAPVVSCTGQLFVQGIVQALGDISSAAEVADVGGTLGTVRATYNTHTHPENDAGGPTGAPNTPVI